MHGHERGGLPAAAPAATQRNYNVPGGPGHGRATARRESRLRWWPDYETGVLLLLAVLTWEKKRWSQTPAPIAPRSSHHLGRVLPSYFTGFS
jgi:hypothetical protein